MAVNDFWRALANAITESEREAGQYINWSLLMGFGTSIAVGGAGNLTLAQMRTSFNCTSGDRLTELNDLASSLNTITLRSDRIEAFQCICQEAGVAARRTRLPSNPFNAASDSLIGDKLRLRAKAIIASYTGGTPQGTLAA